MAYELAPEIHEKIIVTADDKKLEAFYFKHEQVSNKLIVYFHGNAGNAYQRLDVVKQIFDLGQDVLLLSYRGYGKSTGKPSEKGIYLDGQAALTYAKDSLGYQSNNITLFGRSLGTTVAVELAQNQHFNGVILVTPLTSGKAMTKKMGLGLFQFVAGNSLNSLQKIPNITAPVLIVHGTQDEVTPYWMGQALFEAALGEKYMTTIQGGHHNDLQDIDSNSFYGAITTFLNR